MRTLTLATGRLGSRMQVNTAFSTSTHAVDINYLQVVSVYDLSAKDACNAAQRIHLRARQSAESPEVLAQVVKILGGRLTYIGSAARAPDMTMFAKQMLAVEKAWLLSQIGLIPDCDDDVLEEQKWSSCSWMLLREFVRRHAKEVERVRAAVARGEVAKEELDDIPLPRISYVRHLLALLSPADYFAVRVPADHDPT